MGSRERDAKSLQDKLKELFNAKKSGLRGELELGGLAGELGAPTPPARRLRAIRDLTDKLLTYHLPPGGGERVWSLVRDLVEEESGVGWGGQGAALALLTALAGSSRAAVSPPLRCALVRHVRNTLRAPHAAAPAAAAARLRLLRALLGGGRDLTGAEELAAPLLAEWLRAALHPSPQQALLPELLATATAVVKYNASALDERALHALVEAACAAACAAEAAALGAALGLLEAVVAYAVLPRGALAPLVGALCRAANLEPFAAHCWRLMRLVAGADLGHAALREALALAGSAAASEDAAGAARGAVFLVHMALWGGQRAPQLRASPLAVLPALRRAVDARAPALTYEVLLALQALLALRARELDAPAWDALLAVLAAALRHERALRPADEPLRARLHALLDAVEQAHAAGHFAGEPDALLELLDEAAPQRPEAAACRLVDARVQALCGAGAAAGAARALALGERHVRQEPRAAVRLHALAALAGHVARHHALLGDELLERVALPLLGACAADPSPQLRAAAAQHVAALCLGACVAPPALAELVDVLERVLGRPFEAFAGEAPLPPDAEAGELRVAAAGLARLLRERLLRAPAAPAARALLVLLDHLEQHYRRPALLRRLPEARLAALDVVLGLRANAHGAVGLCPPGEWGARAGPPAYSPLLLVEPVGTGGGGSGGGGGRREVPPGAALVPAGRVARALLLALTREREWAVLGRVLRALPQLVGARALCVGRRAAELDALAAALCALCGSGGGAAPSVSELHALVVPALAALAPVHALLDGGVQQRVVRCLLRHGLALRASSAGALAALGLWALEARDTMLRMLPEVLLDLSKLSDTVLVAAPMLELLSTLARLPRVFASLAEDQYMSVFAVVLPYTNPSRYNHYVVSLAHHVIAAWFLKCRLAYRRNFVRFIIHGLHNYIIMPFEEQLQLQRGATASAVGSGAGGGAGAEGAGAGGGANEDSSLRQRSSSLGSRLPRVAPSARAGAGAAAGGDAAASAALHVELTECCVDLLARHAGAPVAPVAARSPPARALFRGGPSATWLVGHRLVTVTTSGCQQHALHRGRCDRCRHHRPPLADSDEDAATGESETEAEAEEVALALEHFRPRLGECGDAEASERAEEPRASAELDGGGGGGRAAACWGAQWAELRVRAPTGDTAFTLRVQNRMGWDPASDAPLHELAALLGGCGTAAGPGPEEPASHPAPAPPQPQLHKSSSDGLVSGGGGGSGGGEGSGAAGGGAGGGGGGGARLATQPINIPGSPQRQSSSSTTDDDDMLLAVPPGKGRHPVRRSNSSPEMSSSWKLAVAAAAREPEPEPEPDDLLLLPPATTTTTATGDGASASQQLLQTKKAAKKSDTRVSCEAIPEEMSGTSPMASAPAAPTAPAAQPQPHPHLQTHNSDPGERSADEAPAPATAATAAAAAAIGDRDDLPPLARSKRSNTISVMSPTRRPGPVARNPAASTAAATGTGGAGAGGGVTPAFVFLSLYHNLSTFPLAPALGEAGPAGGGGGGGGGGARTPLQERPLRVAGAQHERSLKMLDLVPVVETVRVGVVYVAVGQAGDEAAALRNARGSRRYGAFVRALGGRRALPAPFVALEAGRDGSAATLWADGQLHVLFHVATDMPNAPHDPSANEKRKHIGNDYVSIIYNDSGEEFSIHTMKGQLNLCIVVVEPWEHALCRVAVRSKDERVRTHFLPHLEPVVVTDAAAPLLARQLALHAALASQISQSLSLGGAPFASNALERLRLIKRLRRRLEGERLAAAAAPPRPYAAAPALHSLQRVAIDDFNDYT